MPTATMNASDFEDVMTSLVLSRFEAGELPHGCEFSLHGVSDAGALLPIGSVERSARSESAQRVIASVQGCSVMIDRFGTGLAYVLVAGPTAEAVSKVEALIRANAPVPVESSTSVVVEFWCLMPEGLRKVPRRVDAPAWSEVARNYPAPVAGGLSQIVGLERPAGNGRLMLWHGPPGTGKTTAARALAREWAPWCRTLFVVDPDVLFGSGAYLTSLLLQSEDVNANDDESESPAGSARWRLLIVEDADELLRADAKKASGQAMARLLNLADGFLGQGLELLVLLSTNEPIGRLHPAVTRPGRCLAEVAFRGFTRSEASAWLGAPASGEATLAELFNRRGDVDRIGVSAGASAQPGLYL